MRAALNDAPFVLCNRAKRAATEATAHDVDRVFNHIPRRDFRITVRRMWVACVGQTIHIIHFFGGQRNGLHVEPNITFTMLLHQSPCVTWIGLKVQHARSVRVQHRVVRHRFKRGNANHAVQTNFIAFGNQFGFALFFIKKLNGLFGFWRFVRGRGIGFRAVQIRIHVGVLRVFGIRRIHGG